MTEYTDNVTTYPDALLSELVSGKWELAPKYSKVSVHDTREEAYERLKDLREGVDDATGGCLMCSG